MSNAQVAQIKSLIDQLGKVSKSLPKIERTVDSTMEMHRFSIGKEQHMFLYEGDRDVVLRAQEEMQRLLVLQMKWDALLAGLRLYGMENLYAEIMREPLP